MNGTWEAARLYVGWSRSRFAVVRLLGRAMLDVLDADLNRPGPPGPPDPVRVRVVR
jgi:hypothetical protein